MGTSSSLRLGGGAPLTHLASRAFHVNFFTISIYFQVHKYTPFSEIPAYALNKLYAIQILLRKICFVKYKFLGGIYF